MLNLYLDDDQNFANGVVARVAQKLREDADISANLQLATFAPGNYFVVARASRDYASLALENPWDMSDAIDIQSANNFTSPAVSGGVFSGTTSTNDPYFALNVPFNGPDYVDASIYKSLSFQMTLSVGGQFQVYWQRTDSGTVFATPFIPTNAGSQIYTVDLGAEANWSGQVRMLRIDPATAAGVSVSVDSVSLSMRDRRGLVPARHRDGGESWAAFGQRAPIARLVQPDARGGLDYATSVPQQPWNMAEAARISS